MFEFGCGTKIEVLVSDSQANQIIENILKSVSTGSASDGKIFVFEVNEAYDIGTKRTDDTAL
jgi:nitrogen regulatory protein P-II 1